MTQIKSARPFDSSGGKRGYSEWSRGRRLERGADNGAARYDAEARVDEDL